MQVNMKTAAAAVALLMLGIWIGKRRAVAPNDRGDNRASEGTGWTYMPQGFGISGSV